MTTPAEKKDPVPSDAQVQAELAKHDPDEKKAAVKRKAALVYIDCVRKNRGGTLYAEWEVRFSEHHTVDDLQDPGIWRRVQDNAVTALKRFDEVRILAFDASWIAHCVVAHATGNTVILATRSITKLPEQQEHLFQDDVYCVVFVGNGYTVLRKRDELKMTDIRPSAALAEMDLKDLYPKRVA